MTARRTRRRVLGQGAALSAALLGFPTVIPARVLGRNGATAPSEKIVMGCIGVGSMGGGHLRAFTNEPDVHMAAVCDLRRAFRRRACEHVARQTGARDCRPYADYRDLLARGDIDAVCIATPDHWHALVALEAARRGKALYLEKPVDVHVAAARALRDTVNRQGVVFQFGTQQRSDHRFRLACELARNRRLGELRTIVVGSLPGLSLPNQPTQPEPDPDEFDYNMWLGPAPWAPYTFERAASRAEGSVGYWMHIHDYGLGCLSGAWGIHHVDIAQWGNDCDRTGPVRIEGRGTLPQDGLCDTPLTWWVEHRYANGVRMIHADSRQTPERFAAFRSPALQHTGCGVLFIGSEGWVIVSRAGIDARPKSLLQTRFGPRDIRLPVSPGHRRNFLDCIRTRTRPVSHLESAVRSDTVCHLDDIAIRLGRPLNWNPEMEQFEDDEQADRMLTRPLRRPWHL
jgi:hypothetical protein